MMRTSAEALPLCATDEIQGWSAMLLTEFGAISGNGSVAEISPGALERLL
jgi:hypothetical protein